MKKILSVALILAGVGIFLFGNHTVDEAAEGEMQISQAESQGNPRPTLGPVRRHARHEAAEAKQEKIGQEQQRVALFQLNGRWLQGAGALLFIVGIVCFCRSSKST
jgi:hypothetical protein